MKKTNVYGNSNKALSCLIAILFAFTTVTAPLITPNLSYAKYVLDPIEHTISISSAVTYDITSIGAISGTIEVGSTLTAGTIAPSEATVVYQWQQSTTEGGIYTDIAGATSNTYTLTESNYNRYIRVIATGTNNYSGMVISEYMGPVAAGEIEAIGPIIGTAQVGRTLTAGIVTPSEATVVYQWQRATESGGSYVDISGATANTYSLQTGDVGYYIKVQVTGTGSYTGTATSEYKGPIAARQITAIGPISGTAAIGQTLTAGNLTPYGATVNYQWQRSDGTNPFTNIAGATSSSYLLAGADGNCYVRVVATGTGAFTGTVTSDYVGRVGTSIIALTSIGVISGTAEVGQVLTAGTLSPTGATATYQWQRCATVSGIYENITGATAKNYTLSTADKDNYIRVLAIGSSTFTGTVTSASKGPVAAGQLTAMGPISGTSAIGETLTAGTLTPATATVTYQWQRCNTTNGTYTNIINANGSTFTLTSEDVGYFIKVVATGTGAFSGTVTSAYTGPVSMTTTPITSIGIISGNAQVAQTLTAGTVGPSGATVTYQWLRADAAEGPYENILGATTNTYTLSTDDIGFYIKVQASGAGTYTGTVTSTYKGPVTVAQITAIGPISGTTLAGRTLTVGTLTPYGATATYQWQRSNGTDPFIDIVGGTASSYTLTGYDSNNYIRVVATGIGAYTGTVTSDYVGRVGPPITALISIGVISGTAEIGQVLTAGTLSPAGTATYQWQRCATVSGTYEDIPGATATAYTLTTADKDKFIRVVATGSDSYSETVTSASKGPVTSGLLAAIGPINGTTATGQTLSAGTLTPVGATVTYQWQKCSTTNGTYIDIINANASTYTLTTEEEGFYIKVLVTGTGNYTGTVTSAYTGPVSITTTPITSIGTISGTTAIGQTLTAGPLSPAGATATYQWLRCDTDVGTYENIPGATSNTYTLSTGELNHYIKVQAIGAGSYSGTVTSASKGFVAAGQITAISPISGTASVDQTLTVGTLTPYGATATYQWQRSNGTDPFADILGGTASNYTLTGNDSYCYIRVVATGSGSYTGTAISDYVGRVGTSVTTLTSIGAISGTLEVGQILTAGTLSPAGTATYQWQRCTTVNGSFENIPGAITRTYTLSATDKDKFIRVVATGSSNYAGMVTSVSRGPVSAGQLTAIGPITGTTAIGQILTAGTLTPVSATVTYQWQRCNTTNGTYIDIINANASTYTMTAEDEGYYIKVVATGTGAFSGTATSAYIGPVGVTITPITSIGTISGTAQIGKILTAGMPSPSGATVTYQWQRCDTDVGIYENLPGATSNTYTLSATELGKYIKVQVTGAGSYSGTVTSTSKGPVAAGQLTAIGPISGTTAIGLTLTVGNLMPYGATATYQWQRSDSSGSFVDIVGGTSSTYTLTGPDSYCYIRVVATGTGAYTGTATSDYVGRVGILTTPLTSIGTINGSAEVGQILTAGTLSPAGTATYQWQRCTTVGGIYENIFGATAKTYTLTSSDKGKFIKVTATGSSNYTGTVTSAGKGPVTAGQLTAIGPIGGTAAVGQTLTAGITTPITATVTYQWQKCDTPDGSYTNIINANASTYTLTAEDEDFYIKVVVTGIGDYIGTATSTYTGTVGVTATQITSIAAISGITQVGKVLTAGSLNPSEATATYQWMRCITEDGTYEDIPGATSNTYKLTAEDLAYYIKVQAIGSGTFTGSVTSTYVGAIAAGLITSIADIIGTTTEGQTLTAGNLTPIDATVTYQWLKAYSINDTYVNIPGATTSTYSLSSENNGLYLKVRATGTGAYTGTVTSAYTGRVSKNTTPITAFGAISGSAIVGETVTAGTFTPSGATATYQWQNCTTSGGDYVDIPGANSRNYIISESDTDKYLRVVATGSGNYTGTMTSTYIGPVESGMSMMMLRVMMEDLTPITAIGEIDGRAQVGRTLEAGALTPSDADVTYQWQRCATKDGTYEDINGATSSTYTLTDSDETYFIRVVATSNVSVESTDEVSAKSMDTVSMTSTDTVSVTSTAIGPVEARTPITAIGAIDGRAQVGRILKAGVMSPTDAVATYQWQRRDTVDGIFENIIGAEASTYTLTAEDETKYIQVVVTGTGAYSGTVTSLVIGPVEPKTPITAIGAINGRTQVGRILKAGALSPSDADVTYQWQRCATADGIFENISGAEESRYTLTAADETKYIQVVVTGIGAYTGTVASTVIGPVEARTPITAVGEINGRAQVGRILEAGALSPSDAEAEYQWQSCATADGIFENISGAEESRYTLTAGDETKYIQVVVTGTGAYTGTVTSTAIGPVEPRTPITAIGEISGITQVGETLTAGTLDSSEATVVYQWQRSDTEGGSFTDIAGATSNTYLLTEDDYNNYIRVVATGTGAYTGTVESAFVGTVTAVSQAIEATEEEADNAAVDVAPKDAVDETPKDAVDEAPKDAVDETPKDAVDETPKDAVDETPNAAVDETPKDVAPAQTDSTDSGIPSATTSGETSSGSTEQTATDGQN